MAANDLIIRFGARGQEEVQRALGLLGKRGADVAGAFRRLAGILGTSLSAGMFLRTTKQAIDMADAMAKAAQGAGIAVQEYSALSHVANLAGLAQTHLSLAVGKLAQEMSRSGRGGRSIVEEMAELADQFAAMPDGARKTALAMDIFGEEVGRKMVPLLNQGSEAMREQIAEAERLGIVISDDLARNAQQFNDDLNRTKAILQGVFLQFVDQILPNLIEQIQQLNRFLEQNQGLVDALVNSYRGLAASISLVIRLTEAQAALFAVTIKHLLAGEDASKALGKALKEVGRIWEEYQKQVESIFAGPEGGGAGAGGPGLTGAILRQEDELRELIKQDELRLRASTQATISSNEARRERLQILSEERERLSQLMELVSERAPAMTEGGLSAEVAQWQAEMLQLQQQRARLDAEIAATSSSIQVQMALSMRALGDQLGNAAQIIARNFTGIINTSIDSVADGISGLVQGTLTWGQALRNIGTNILQGVINAISRMFAEWIVQRLIVSNLEKLLSAQEAAAKAPSALFSSISTGGIATAVGLAALLAAIAALSGAFAEGGRPPVGRMALVGERGPELFVPDQSGVIMPAGATAEALSGGGIQNQIQVAAFIDRSVMTEWLKSGEGKKTILDVVGRNRHEFS